MGISVSGAILHVAEDSRGSYALDLKPASFVTYTAESRSAREFGVWFAAARTDNTGRYKAITALLLLRPDTPMLFQGQEYGAQHLSCILPITIAELAAWYSEGAPNF